MDALRLVLTDNDVLDGGSRHKIEDSISISSLSLLVAAALYTLVTLHLPVKGLPRVDVHGLVEHDGLLSNREFDTREREARWWSSAEVALSGICTALRSIALLVLATSQCSC